MGFSISEFRIDAYDEVFALWKQCEGMGLNEADSRHSIAAYLERNPGMSFVARDGERLVGAVLGGHDGRRGYLHHLAVLPACRRQGLGRQLVVRSLEALQAAGIGKCHLFVYSTNTGGMAFWRAEGWQLREDIRVMSR